MSKDAREMRDLEAMNEERAAHKYKRMEAHVGAMYRELENISYRAKNGFDNLTSDQIKSIDKIITAINKEE